jgi:hypothetical protein
MESDFKVLVKSRLQVFSKSGRNHVIRYVVPYPQAAPFRTLDCPRFDVGLGPVDVIDVVAAPFGRPSSQPFRVHDGRCGRTGRRL